MNESLAKGYATQFLNEQQDFSCLKNWLDSGNAAAAQSVFKLSCTSDSPEWVLNRIKSLVCPPFQPPVAVSWNNNGKAIVACALTASHESNVLENIEQEISHFEGTERSLFWTDLVFEQRRDETHVNLITAAHVSHHTLSRMLERGLASPGHQIHDTSEILMVARSVRQFFEITSLDKNKTWNLLIPFADGAFVARMLRANAGVRDYYQGNHPIVSLRTFLDGSKIKDHHRERMAGFKLIKDAYCSSFDVEYMKSWIRGNARVHLTNALHV